MMNTRKPIRTILIAHEDAAVRKSIGLVFPISKGYRVVATPSGMDAILKAKEIEPDMVLAGVFLSDKDGYEVSREIKNDPFLENTSVILLAESLGAFNEVKAAKACADDFIIKPFDVGEITKKVESFISQKREMTFELFSQIEEGSKKEALAGFETFNKKTEEKPKDPTLFEKVERKDNGPAEKIKLEGSSEFEEEIILLEEEVRDDEPDAKSIAGEIKTSTEESKSQIVDKVSQIIIKRLNEIIPELVSQVVDSIMKKEEIKKIKKG